MSSAPVIHFDYESSPYGQKTKLLLTAAGIPFTRIDQPAVLPRPDLERLGITYRRIPLLAIGRDVYADSAAVIDIILSQLEGASKIKTTVADKAWAAWGDVTFNAVLPLVPSQALTDAFVKDRRTIFPILDRPDFKTMQPSTTAELRSRMAFLEKVVLKDSPYVGGDKLSLADIHVIWSVRWALLDLGAAQQPGLGKDTFPKVWKLIESLPKPAAETLSNEKGLQQILDAELSAEEVQVDSNDPIGIKAGTQVLVESVDAEPGAHPQAGKLVGCSVDEIVLALETGVRLHFPRNGYLVRESGAAKL